MDTTISNVQLIRAEAVREGAGARPLPERP